MPGHEVCTGAHACRAVLVELQRHTLILSFSAPVDKRWKVRSMCQMILRQVSRLGSNFTTRSSVIPVTPLGAVPVPASPPNPPGRSFNLSAQPQARVPLVKFNSGTISRPVERRNTNDVISFRYDADNQLQKTLHKVRRSVRTHNHASQLRNQR